MPRFNERNNDNSGSSSRRSSRRQQEQEPAKTVEYYPIFSLFGSEHRGGRLQIDIKAYDGKNGSIEDHLTVEEFLFFCEKLYYGEPLVAGDEYGVKLVGSLWEMDTPTKESTHSGNIRFSEDMLKSLKHQYSASVNAGKKKTTQKSSKPKYTVPEDDEDDDEYEEVQPKPKSKANRKPPVELDMEVEEVDTQDDSKLPF